LVVPLWRRAGVVAVLMLRRALIILMLLVTVALWWGAALVLLPLLLTAAATIASLVLGVLVAVVALVGHLARFCCPKLGIDGCLRVR
jgi:hypothetical protein